MRGGRIRIMLTIMMMITLNGNKTELPDNADLNTLLELKRWKMVPMSVKIDGNLIPREKYALTKLSDGQIIQIIPFIGGG